MTERGGAPTREYVRPGFWQEAFALSGSITPVVLPLVFTFGGIAGVISVTAWLLEHYCQFRLGLEVAPYEFAGAALGLLLVLRTNAGYDRWWEARKLWGGIVNQSRNLVISGLSYGPTDAAWQDELVRWAAVFPHVVRSSLRGEPPSPEVSALLGPEAAAQLAAADHMPSVVAMHLGGLLRDACERMAMDRYAFLQIDRERAMLMDHVGACERILKTPLPRVYAIKIRRFITIFLVTMPLALLHRLSNEWFVPVMTMLVAYPLISLDQIGVELENPFASRNLSHLPIDDIAAMIERNAFGLLRVKQAEM
jgi:putative membrane protein